MEPDYALVRCIIDGDRTAAVDRLISGHDKRLRGFAGLLLSHKRLPACSLDEVMQNTYIAIWEKGVRLSRDTSEADLLRYIRAIVRHKVSDIARQHWGTQTTPLEDVDPPSSEPGLERQISSREDLDELRGYISTLPPIHQQILELKSRRTPDNEIAEIVGMSPGKVRVTIFRLRKKMRQWRKERL